MGPIKPLINDFTETELYQASIALEKATGKKWVIQDSQLSIEYIETNSNWERERQNCIAKLKAIGLEVFNVSTTEKGAAKQGDVRVSCSISNSTDIKNLAQQFKKSFGKATIEPTAEQSLDAKKNAMTLDVLSQACEYLNKTSNFKESYQANHQTEITKLKETWQAGGVQLDTWHIDGHMLKWQGFVEAPGHERSAEKISSKLTKNLGSNHFIVDATGRFMPEGLYSVTVACNLPSEINRLADLNSPQVILTNADSTPRSLATIAATLCVFLGIYNKKDLAMHKPDFKMPFPLLHWSNDGLDIKLPRELVIEKSMLKPLELFANEKGVSIAERHFNKDFVAKVTIPWYQIGDFIKDRLGLETMTIKGQKFDTIGDIILTESERGSGFSDKQIDALTSN